MVGWRVQESTAHRERAVPSPNIIIKGESAYSFLSSEKY